MCVRKAHVWTVQEQRSGIIRRLERLFKQQEGLYRTRFSRAIRAGKNRQRTNLDVALPGEGLVAANRNAGNSFGRVLLLRCRLRST